MKTFFLGRTDSDSYVRTEQCTIDYVYTKDGGEFTSDEPSVISNEELKEELNPLGVIRTIIRKYVNLPVRLKVNFTDDAISNVDTDLYDEFFLAEWENDGKADDYIGIYLNVNKDDYNEDEIEEFYKFSEQVWHNLSTEARINIFNQFQIKKYEY